MPDNKTVTFDASRWQIVPKVPTDEMRDAGNVHVRNRSVLYDAWKSMLAAAPTPAAQSAGQEAVAEVRDNPDDIGSIIETLGERPLPVGMKLYAAPVNGGDHYAELEREHFGDPDKRTGIYAQRAADAQQVGGDRDAIAELIGRLEARYGNEFTFTRRSGEATHHVGFDKHPLVGKAITYLRAALTSPAKVPDAVMQALDRMSTPLHDSRLSGLTAELDAANIKTIRDYVLSGSSPAKLSGDQHPDDAAVDRFAVAMKAKLAKKRAQGRGGWDDERVCSPDDLARMLVDHVRKGDPVDVGNLAMMLFNRPDAGAALCRAALSADGGEAANLEGLRDKLFDGRQVTRDAEGWYYHPALPNTDEDVNLENLLAALRIESVFVSMESDDSEAADRYGEAGEADCHYWKPTAPEGEGWRLLAVYDTEDGPYALFGRDAYVAEQKRKQEHTRRIAAAIAANQAKGE